MFERERLMKKDWDEVSSRTALLGALIKVYDDLSAANLKPGAEDWVTNRQRFLAELRPRIVRQWCEDTGRMAYEFPWVDDFLVKSWVDWRKALDDVKPEIRSRCGLLPLMA